MISVLFHLNQYLRMKDAAAHVYLFFNEFLEVCKLILTACELDFLESLRDTHSGLTVLLYCQPN